MTGELTNFDVFPDDEGLFMAPPPLILEVDLITQEGARGAAAPTETFRSWVVGSFFGDGVPTPFKKIEKWEREQKKRPKSAMKTGKRSKKQPPADEGGGGGGNN